jgi:hypothetical protein
MSSIEFSDTTRSNRETGLSASLDVMIILPLLIRK